jgi:hypothetical protein
VASHTGADLGAELIVDAEPRAILAPGAKGLIGRLPMRQIMRHQAPRTAGAQHILDAIEHLTHGVFARSTTRFFRWQEGLQNLPLLVGKVCGVGQVPG